MRFSTSHLLQEVSVYSIISWYALIGLFAFSIRSFSTHSSDIFCCAMQSRNPLPTALQESVGGLGCPGPLDLPGCHQTSSTLEGDSISSSLSIIPSIELPPYSPPIPVLTSQTSTSIRQLQPHTSIQSHTLVPKPVHNPYNNNLSHSLEEEENHVIDWNSAEVVAMEAQRQTRWIKEALWIRKTPRFIDRDAGSYQLCHTWDQVISGSRAPSRCKQSTRREQDVRRTSKRSH